MVYENSGAGLRDEKRKMEGRREEEDKMKRKRKKK